MQSRSLFVTLFIVMCLLFAVFAADEAQNEDTLSFSFNTTDDQIQKWKAYLQSISADERETLFSKLKEFYGKLPAEVQDKVADAAANFIDRHDIQITTTEGDSDLLADLEDPTEEFVCGGLCIGLGVLAAGAIAKIGYDGGAKKGKKAAPVIHKYYHDDDDTFLPFAKKLLKVFGLARDGTQGLLTDSNPGKHTHVYHYDDDESLNIDVEGLKDWIAKWRSMTPEEKQRQKEIMKHMWSRMSDKMQQYYKSQMRSLLKIQQGANPEEDAFVCGGACIAIAVVAGAGIWRGARNAGKANHQRHEHHHYKKK